MHQAWAAGSGVRGWALLLSFPGNESAPGRVSTPHPPARSPARRPPLLARTLEGDPMTRPGHTPILLAIAIALTAPGAALAQMGGRSPDPTDGASIASDAHRPGRWSLDPWAEVQANTTCRSAHKPTAAIA